MCHDVASALWTGLFRASAILSAFPTSNCPVQNNEDSSSCRFHIDVARGVTAGECSQCPPIFQRLLVLVESFSLP